jgi:hypothetical protein
MRARTSTFFPFVVVSLLVLIAIGLVAGIDWFLSRTRENVQSIALSRASADGLSDLQSDVADLQKRARLLALEVQDKGGRRLPLLEDLNEAARTAALIINKVERVRSSDNKQWCQAVLVGRIGRVVRFLESVEGDYLFHARRVEMAPEDASGELIAMTLIFELGNR